MLTHQTFLHVLHVFRMLPRRLFIQWVWRSFAIYGHPGLLSQRQVRYDQIIPRFSPFESVHKQAEKFALNIECHEFDELHSLQPPVHPGDTRQPLTGALISTQLTNPIDP